MESILNWTNGTLRGTTTIKTQAAIRVLSSADRHFHCMATNHGLVDIAEDMIVYTVDVTDRLVNAADGTVRKSAGTASATAFWVPVDNGGLIEGQAGMLWLRNGGTIGGQIVVSNAATVQLLGGAFVLTPYIFSGAGFFGLSAGSDVTLGGTLSEAMGWNDGTLRGEFTISPVGSLTVSGSADRHFNCI